MRGERTAQDMQGTERRNANSTLQCAAGIELDSIDKISTFNSGWIRLLFSEAQRKPAAPPSSGIRLPDVCPFPGLSPTRKVVSQPPKHAAACVTPTHRAWNSAGSTPPFYGFIPSPSPFSGKAASSARPRRLLRLASLFEGRQ